MSKKLLVAVLALALFFGVTPVKSVKAISSDELTVEAVQEWIPDPVFAQAIVDAILADTSVVYSDYYNVRDLLRNYSGTIKYDDTTKLIQSIEGINYLENAHIVLDNQAIENLIPLGDKTLLSGDTRAYVNIGKSPVHIWFTEIPDTVEQKHTVPNPFFAEGVVKMVYEPDATLNINVKYDVYQGTPTTVAGINDSARATFYKLTGNTSVPGGKTKPVDGDSTAEFTFAKDDLAGSAVAGIELKVITYYSYMQQDDLRIGYTYTINPEFVFPVYFEKEATSTFSVKLVKYSTEDTEKANPLAGAKYELYKENVGGEPATLIGTYTTESKPVVISDLEAGDYYFVEIEAPKGYKKDETPIAFSYSEQEAVDVTFTGLDTSVEVTAENAQYLPNWLPGIGSVASEPLPLTTKNTGTANSSDYSKNGKTCIGFVSNNEEDFSISYTVGNVSDDFDVKYTWYVNDTKVDDVKAYLKNMVDKGTITSDITIKVVEEFTIADSAVAEAEGLNTPITIWVENSTENDEGGTVNVEGCKEDEISSSGVYENTPREINNVVEGQAYKEDNWYVVVDEIKVGPMGEDGVSGAVYTVVEQPQDEDGNYVITLEDGSEIKVRIDYDQKNEHVVVTIVDMDRNIDVAIPFARHEQEPVPVTGDNSKTAILVAAMLASSSLIGYAFFAKRKEEE